MQLDEKDVLDDKSKRKKIALRRTIKKGVEKKIEIIDESTLALPNKKKVRVDWLPMIDRALRWVFFGMVFLLPIFFLPFTTDVLELNKQILLFVGTCALALLSILRWLIAKKCELKVTPIYIGMGTWLGAWLVASLFSLYPYQSFIGIEKQEFMSFTTLLSLSLFAFFSIQVFAKNDVIVACRAFFLSTALATVFQILQLFGIYLLPWDFARQPAFGLMGQYDLWGGVVACAMVLAIANIIRVSLAEIRQKIESILLAVFVALCLIVLLLLNDWRLWFSTTLGLVTVVAFLFSRVPKTTKTPWLFFPSFVVIFSALMIFVPVPHVLRLPLNVQPTWGASLSIAVQSLSEKPFFGFGPGNFLSNYTRYRPAEINQANYLKLWSVRFDQSSSHLFTVMAAIGLVGMLGIVVFAIFFLLHIFRYLFKEQLHDEYAIVLGLFGSIVALRILALLKPSNMTLVFLFWLFIACILALTVKKVRLFTSKNLNSFLFGSSFVFWTLVATACVGGFFFVQRYAAEIWFAHALKIDRDISARNQNQQQINTESLDSLIAALTNSMRINPYHHTYPRMLSQSLSYKLSYILKTTDSTKQQEVLGTVQSLTSSAIDASKKALMLHPYDVRNATNLANLYEGIAPLADGAENFAAENYKKAIDLEPTNPENVLNLGKFYLTMATLHAQKAAASKEEKGKTAEMQESQKNLGFAKEQLNAALKLKTDYAVCYYYLGLIDAQNNQNTQALSNFDVAMNTNIALARAGAQDDSLFYSLGMAYLGLQEKTRAADAFKNTLDLNAQYTPAAWQYALLLSEKEETKTNAIAILENLLKSDPSNETIIKKIQDLQTPKKETATTPPPQSEQE